MDLVVGAVAREHASQVIIISRPRLPDKNNHSVVSFC